ncbi:hypothetical protein MRX96_006323 [Rhipicephalus microplus]
MSCHQPTLPLLLVIATLMRTSGAVSVEQPKASMRDFVETPTPAKVNVAVVSFDRIWRQVDNSLARHLPWPKNDLDF